jgi:hypothetical protein
MSVSIYDNGDAFNRRFEQRRDELVVDEQSSKATSNQRMADLLQLQQQEILRLQKVLKDNTIVPERHAVTMAISSVLDPKNGLQKHVLLATANDRSMWLLENYKPGGRPEYFTWGRIPNLPQAADEADAESKT